MMFGTIRNILYLRNNFCTNISPVAVQSILTSNVTKENQYELVLNTVTPFWKIDYPEQILIKKKWAKNVLKMIKSKYKSVTETKIQKVIPSIQLAEYRNTDEFSIQTGIDGDPKTVGFFVRSNKMETFCVPPYHLKHIRSSHLEVVKVFQDFIRASPLKACHRLDDNGFWRGIAVKSNNKGEILVMVLAHPSGIPEDNMDSMKQDLIQHFQLNLPSVISLYVQLCPHVKCTPEQAPFTLLSGTTHITENIGGYTINISPARTHHVNIETIPLLYNSVLNYMNLDKTYTLLDLNCSIGLTSIFASRYVRGCFGIDESSLCIEDAALNAQNNNISNCHFINGKIEQELVGVISEINLSPNIVAVIHVGKTGIRRDVIKLLRRCAQLKKLVCICRGADHPIAITSFAELCRPKFDLSEHFNVTRIQAIDMNPHTNCCDLIMVFEKK